MAEETRLVVVGYGMGAYHARLIEETDGLKLLGVCDVAPTKRTQAAGDHPGIRLYEQFEAVLADPEVDAVVVVTPHSTHAQLALAAMDAGKHTITDKAMCLTVAEARAMIAARDRKQVLLTTFHNRRWDSEFLTVRQVVEAGALGRLYHIESCVTGFGHPGGWRADRPLMGGWLYDWGAHTLDQILLLAQARPTGVYAFTHHRHQDPGTVEDYVNCAVTFDGGLTATTVVSYLSRLPMPRWYILGETGTLVGEDFEKPLRLKAPMAGIEAETTLPLVRGDWHSFYNNFAAAAAGRSELAVKPEELLPQIAIAEAAYRSVETGQAQAVEY